MSLPTDHCLKGLKDIFISFLFVSLLRWFVVLSHGLSWIFIYWLIRNNNIPKLQFKLVTINFANMYVNIKQIQFLLIFVLYLKNIMRIYSEQETVNYKCNSKQKGVSSPRFQRKTQKMPEYLKNPIKDVNINTNIKAMNRINEYFPQKKVEFNTMKSSRSSNRSKSRSGVSLSRQKSIQMTKMYENQHFKVTPTQSVQMNSPSTKSFRSNQLSTKGTRNISRVSGATSPNVAYFKSNLFPDESQPIKVRKVQIPIQNNDIFDFKDLKRQITQKAQGQSENYSMKNYFSSQTNDIFSNNKNTNCREQYSEKPPKYSLKNSSAFKPSIANKPAQFQTPIKSKSKPRKLIFGNHTELKGQQRMTSPRGIGIVHKKQLRQIKTQVKQKPGMFCSKKQPKKLSWKDVVN